MPQDLPQHIQVLTGLKCAECGEPTIWRVNLWHRSPLEWYLATIRDAELGIQLARKDAPRICPNEQCRKASIVARDKLRKKTRLYANIYNELMW
jgi:hypothetical protein